MVDDKNKILVQVSTTASFSKIQQSLIKIPEKRFDGYHFIFTAITDHTPKYKKHFWIPSGVVFDPNYDVLDIPRVLSIVMNSPINKQEQLSEVCSSFSLSEADERQVDFQLYTPVVATNFDRLLSQIDFQSISKEKDKREDSKLKSDAIDPSKTPILFSVCTKKAYDINSEYYKGLHYVWCAPFFSDPLQPPTSNPYSIYTVLQDIILHRDIHAKEISDNKAGLLRGASAREKQGLITAEERDIISYLIDKDLNTDHFFPVIYVIPVVKLDNYERRCEKQPKQNCASGISEEYIIRDLKRGEFYLIDLTATLDRIPHTDTIFPISR